MGMYPQQICLLGTYIQQLKSFKKALNVVDLPIALGAFELFYSILPDIATFMKTPKYVLRYPVIEN